jgi:hypothetical protein
MASAFYRPVLKTIEIFLESLMKRIVLACCLVFYISFGIAIEVAGHAIPEKIQRAEDGVELVLNGVGVREKFFFDIYIAALYLEQQSNQAAEVVMGAGAARVEMVMLYSKVEKEKFVQGWREGFEANLEPDQFNRLSERLDQFNGLFETLHQGDRVVLDYFPGKGTRVMLKGHEKGVIEGADFFQALLKVWLGDKPVTEPLKQDLLGS